MGGRVAMGKELGMLKTTSHAHYQLSAQVVRKLQKEGWAVHGVHREQVCHCGIDIHLSVQG